MNRAFSFDHLIRAAKQRERHTPAVWEFGQGAVNVRFAPKRPKRLSCHELTGCARRHLQRSKEPSYSITSSVRASRVAGTSRPRARVNHHLELVIAWQMPQCHSPTMGLAADERARLAVPLAIAVLDRVCRLVGALWQTSPATLPQSSVRKVPKSPKNGHSRFHGGVLQAWHVPQCQT
jgi:hypothetical protein